MPLFGAGLNRRNLDHALRTTLAATASFAMARALHLTQPYWAAISTIVVTQSTLGAALTVSGQRWAGTALGAAAGAALAPLGWGVYAFAIGVLTLGVVCPMLRLDRAAYRFAGITVAIVVLGSPGQAAWRTAIGRFAEVSVGIGVGLGVTRFWQTPEPESKIT